MKSEEFIILNRECDIRSLALKKVPEGVDALWCLSQIEGYQLAKKKLPRWAATDGLHYPPRLSMEQCSSEATALYKQNIVRRLVYAPSNSELCTINSALRTPNSELFTMTCDSLMSSANNYELIDLTGGFGVDFSYMAQGCQRATYIERQEVLCDVARHNMPLLGLPDAEIICGDGAEWITAHQPTDCCTIVFADPARRDDAGRKTVAIEHCTPDISVLQDDILRHAHWLMVKMSPMLDISLALRSLRNVTEVHTVSVKGECKELLFVMKGKATTLDNLESDATTDATARGIRYYCANLDTPDEPFSCTTQQIEEGRAQLSCVMPEAGMMLYEPNASILKAGVQEAFAQRYSLRKLHPCSNLYVGNAPDELCSGTVAQFSTNVFDRIPARRFVIRGIIDFSKPSLKALRSEVRQANITVRNFPSTVDELRKRLKIKDGGNTYLFVTTLLDGTHILLKTEKK